MRCAVTHTLLLTSLMGLFLLPRPGLASSPDPRPIELEQAVEWALHDPALEQEQRATSDVFLGAADQQSGWPNPTLEWERDALFGTPVDREDSLVVEQTIPLSGRHRHLADALRATAEARRWEVVDDQRQLAHQVQQHFYDLLATQDQLDAINESVDQLQRTLSIMERRVDAGESPPYALERLRLAATDLRSTRSEYDAQRQFHQQRLQALFDHPDAPDTPESIVAEGPLAPDSVPDAEYLDQALEDHPLQEAHRAHQRAAEAESKAAQSGWRPDLYLQAGLLHQRDQQDSRRGWIGGIGIDLPLFDRLQGDRLTADATSRARASSHHLQFRQMDSEARAQWRRAQTLCQSAQDYAEEAFPRSDQILDLAQRSYDAGEIALSDLLDAHDEYRGARLRRTDLQSQCRQTLLELRFLIADED